MRFISDNPRVADRILGLVTEVSPSALAIENARGFEVVNELVVNQNAVHTRMMESLNDALEGFIERQRKLEEEAAQKEEERNKKHAAAMQSLQDQQAELDRQSHISERRRLGREVLNPEKLGSSLSERLPVTFFGVCVFLVSMIAGGVFAFQSIASLEALSSDIKVLDLTRKLMENLPPYSPEDVLGLSQYEALKEIVDGLPVLTWFLGAKVLISGLLAVGAFTYGASWMKRYYDDANAVAEWRRRIAADITRAGWVIEAIHEVHQQEGAQALPEVWVEAVTRNLFSDRQAVTELDEGTKALRALLGLSAGVTVGPDGTQFELNKRGTSKLAKSGD
jgi:hypothetical protein